ncbi:hypothetical protein E3N88_12259 [Mikania micrantha]|uniref:Uncharacterized protein n=1 Tax=Mikania micrantha TaxID=192012 RepID=A0A5N6P500_9ASTR|nr:hypothetical protein E3N88_12259 [Mikania micrantha]
MESSRRTTVNSINDIPNNHKYRYCAPRRTKVNSVNSGITAEDRSQLNQQQFNHRGGPKSTQSTMTHSKCIIPYLQYISIISLRFEERALT